MPALLLLLLPLLLKFFTSSKMCEISIFM